MFERATILYVQITLQTPEGPVTVDPCTAEVVLREISQIPSRAAWTASADGLVKQVPVASSVTSARIISQKDVSEFGFLWVRTLHDNAVWYQLLHATQDDQRQGVSTV